MAVGGDLDGSSLVDASTLWRLESDLGPEATSEIVMAFLSSLPDRLAELRSAESAADSSGVKRAAHTLKSSAALVGATGFAERALEVEQGQVGPAVLIDLAPVVATQLRAWMAGRMS